MLADRYYERLFGYISIWDYLPCVDFLYLNGVKYNSVNFTYLRNQMSYFLCSLLNEMFEFAKVTWMGCDQWECPKIHLKH